jgi:hypothetical protein
MIFLTWINEIYLPKPERQQKKLCVNPVVGFSAEARLLPVLQPNEREFTSPFLVSKPKPTGNVFEYVPVLAARSRLNK